MKLGNFVGVHVESALAVTIGGTLAGAGNVISGNLLAGIAFYHSPTGNLAVGNYVGLNAAGTAARRAFNPTSRSARSA